jgi:hypothetical protein
MKKSPPTRQRGSDGRFATHATAKAHGKRAAKRAIAPLTKKPAKAVSVVDTTNTTSTKTLSGKLPSYASDTAPSPAEIAERGRVKRRPAPVIDASESGADAPD